MMKKIFRVFLISLLILYIAACILFYAFQKNLLFHPVTYPSDYQVKIEQPHEELNFVVRDGVKINSLLIKTDSVARGLIFYLHGNGGTIYERVDQAKLFTDAGYDFFMPDYREYGKKNLHFPVFPSFLIKYKLETYRYLPDVNGPVSIYHGASDTLIPSESGDKLSELFRPGDELTILQGRNIM